MKKMVGYLDNAESLILAIYDGSHVVLVTMARPEK